MIMNDTKINNVFKSDDKDGQFLYNTINNMVNHLNMTKINGIYLDPSCFHRDYVRGIVYIDVDFKDSCTDTDFDVIYNAETLLRDNNIDCVISPNDIDGHEKHIRLV